MTNLNRVYPDYMEEWENFLSLPGERLLWDHKKGVNYLKSENGLVLASTPGWTSPRSSSWIMGESGRRYRYRSYSSISDEEIADLDARYGRAFFGEYREGFKKRRRDGRLKFVAGYGIWEDADSGEAVLRNVGANFDLRAEARMGFSDGRWLSFPVYHPLREYKGRHAVMYAESGPKNETLIRYRYRPSNSWLSRSWPALYWAVKGSLPIEIVVAPESDSMTG
jgi:hypothetical protein